MKSLVVDDDATAAFIYKTQLSRYGESHTVSTGIEAINAYIYSLDKNHPYDLIVLDVMMPDINGDEVLKIIRQTEEKRQIYFPFCAKIIITTSLDDIINRKIAQNLDICSEAYLVKSGNRKDLTEKLDLLGFDLNDFD